ncbi:hypothetical protein AtubIFM55763_010175 [Aspergillus tubingensis]|uniref:Methyltransferase domain-containing protein n=1 Tax=Aspergillus tubingensis TaxID=5068 RepID=A0A9W6AYL9_ASPTU|nr:hypothetical protein AtubIFM55763_010175 [Aspergillus tubingensis]GLA90378.1 hypothetical protein AtubIFM56815_005943 [Aspergillus tubingensis]GLB01478.1 hypothetical protein AtubIFM57143_011466 [Aspergillus tubingensis]GLB20847.1 hypothetical protein AtubIFM61612_010795 [Aspergillus tubingensis]
MDILLSSYLHDEKARTSIVEPNFQHRLALTQTWDIAQGSRVLDIGCGQGESSLVLALINGSHGQITAIDTAPPDYGGPYTVEQSQKHIQASTLGQRIQFLRTDTAGLLSQPTSTVKFDAAVLCHSLWYFPDRASIAQVFQLLADAKVRYLCLAEYGFRASRPAQVPHILAARAQAQYHSLRKPPRQGRGSPTYAPRSLQKSCSTLRTKLAGERNAPATYNLTHSCGMAIGKWSSFAQSCFVNGSTRKAYQMMKL